MEALRETMSTELEALQEVFAQWRGNFSLLKTYLSEMEEAFEALEAENKEQGLQALEAVRDLLRVIKSDTRALKRGLTSFQKQVSP